MSTAHVLAGIAWDPQIRGFLAVARRRRGPDGLGLPAARAPTSAPGSGFLIAVAGFFGWMTIMGVDLVDLRHHRHARRGARTGRSRRSSTRAT